MSLVCDLDGTVWLGDRVIPGAPAAVAAARQAGHRVLFVTNNSGPRLGDVEAKLAGMGILAEGDVISSATAAATLVDPGQRVYVIGGPGVVEALQERGADVASKPPIDAVVVGRDLSFTFDKLIDASLAVRSGARFIATNDDATYPTHRGLEPGGGALVAAVTTATATRAVVAGKPNAPMAALVRSRIDPGDDVVMIGDRPDTDGLFATRLGCRFGLVLTGVVTGSTDDIHPRPDLVGPDLAALVAQLLDGSH